MAGSIMFFRSSSIFIALSFAFAAACGESAEDPAPNRSGAGGQAASSGNGGRAGGSNGGSSGGAARGGASGAGNSSGALGAGAASDASSGGVAGNGGNGGGTRDGAVGVGGSAGDCTQNCKSTGLDCCNGRCVNLRNDIQNCGSCGNACSGPRPFCSFTKCGEPICTMTTPCATASYCCENTCCNDGQLCCAHFGGPAGSYFCHTPTAEQPTCPPGCPLCP